MCRISKSAAAEKKKEKQSRPMSSSSTTTPTTTIPSISYPRTVSQAIYITCLYWYTLIQYIFFHQKYSQCQLFQNDLYAKVHIYSLSLIFYLWNKPHYRSKSFQQDMINNLQNVAIPGTGLPLNIFVRNYWLCLYFIFFINPMICLFGAINKTRNQTISWNKKLEFIIFYYFEHLIHPNDWFTFWQLNCRLCSYHSMITKSSDFNMEDKWTFLVEGERYGAAISPFLTNMKTIVCKNKNIEGGMGIHFFTNAAYGGDWIIQEKLTNATWLCDILPPNPPLSTMRIITCSTWSLENDQINNKREDIINNYMKYITPLSSVLRLGRANASTDHSSVLFNVDLKTGIIQGGMSNAHWYRLGLNNIFTCPWLPPDIRAQCDMTKDPNVTPTSNVTTPSIASGYALSHPDLPNVIITGQKVPDMDKAVDIVLKTHFQMMPDVPMVGWDVAFTPNGIYLLEVNLSCNFFRGSFDIPKYISIVDQYWLLLEKIEKEKKRN